jgi:hypothetical protein
VQLSLTNYYAFVLVIRVRWRPTYLFETAHALYNLAHVLKGAHSSQEEGVEPFLLKLIPQTFHKPNDLE